MKKIILSLLILTFLVGVIWSQTTREEFPNVEPFMSFWRRMQSNIADGKIDLSKNYQIQIKSNFVNKKVVSGNLEFFINENSPELLEVLKNFMTAVDDSNLLKVIALDSFSEDLKNADLQIKFTDQDVNFQLVMEADSENSAQNITSRFRMIFNVTARLTQDVPEEEFYKNAIIFSEKNKISVQGKISRKNFEQFLRNL
jgi:hypothetical protein